MACECYRVRPRNCLTSRGANVAGLLECRPLAQPLHAIQRAPHALGTTRLQGKQQYIPCSALRCNRFNLFEADIGQQSEKATAV